MNSSCKASDSDQFLLKELIEFEGFNGHPLGLVLISSKKICDICGKGICFFVKIDL